MKTYTPDKLAAILAAHSVWLMDLSKGKRADLRGSDLRGSNLRGSNLSYSNLSYSNLSDSNLSDSNLSYSDLSGSNLSYSNLRDSNLSYSDLRGSNLSGSILPSFLIVPQQGSFIAWKKASGAVVKLEIPADARRCNSLVGRKCRAEFVRVLAIDGDTTAGKSVAGSHDLGTVYTVGEITRPDSYDDDIRVQCTNGIHFFITKEEAEQW